MFKLVSVDVRGFRGIVERRTLNFDQPVTVLFGENHQGKSSILNAIEWCLFGEECIGARTGLRERIAWEVVSRASGEVSVAVELSENGQKYLVRREQRRTGGRRGRGFSLLLPDGSEAEGEEGERRLSTLIRFGFRDFLTTVYQHQEAIRAILTQEPKERNDAMDRLLGLSDYRNISQGLAKCAAATVQKGMAQQLQDFERQVEVALAARTRELDERRASAQSLGVSDEGMTGPYAVRLAGQIHEGVAAFAGDLGLPAPALPLPPHWKECKEFCRAARDAIRLLLAKAPVMREQQGLVERKTRLEREEAQCRQARDHLRDVRQEGDRLSQESGTKENLQESLSKVSSEVESVKAQMVREDQRILLLVEGMRVLEAAGADVVDQVCPLCGSRVDDLLEHVREEWERRKRTAVAQFEATKSQREAEREELRKKLSRHEDVENRRRKASDEFAKAAKNVAVALERELAEGEDPVAVAAKEIGALSQRLAELEALIRQRQDRARDIEAEVDKLWCVYEVLELRDRMQVIESIKESEEFRQIQQLLEEVAQIVGDIQHLQRAVKEAAQDEARDKIAAAEAALDRHFRALTQNPLVARLQIGVDSKETGNDYRILDQDGNELAPVLSQGDMNSLALALFLGLGQAAAEASRFGFLLFDDPSQSLGSEQKGRFVEELDAAAAMRQLVVSTMDAQLKELLEAKITKSRALYSFANWSPQEGPQITRSE